MSDREVVTSDEYVVTPKAPGWLIGVSILALVVALGAVGFAYGLNNHLEAAQQAQTAANARSQALADKLEQTNDRMRAQGEMLGQSVGLTQKQLEAKTAQLVEAQHVAAASTAKLAKAQDETAAQVNAVKTDVSSVKTDVGGVKTDVATTQADLANTKTALTRVMGDAGVMSGLIATNHDELEQLKHRGDRNYYEFTLDKGQKKPVGTVSMELRKTDAKKSKFTLNVYADDKKYEKANRNLNEPLQFYSGKTPGLYEIVVNSINSKNQISGYLSTPNN